MRTLILLRHGEAQARAGSGRDLDRALTPRGRDDAEAAGAALAAAGLVPDLALVSPARRTRETWAAAAATLGRGASEVRDDLYDAPAQALLAAAEACEADVVAVVAHNPGIGELAARLGGDDAPFPPASVAAFTWNGAATDVRLRWSPPR